MTDSTLDYFERRAQAEERLAALSIHRGVKATHERFAATYREQVEIEHSMPRLIGQREDATRRT